MPSAQPAVASRGDAAQARIGRLGASGVTASLDGFCADLERRLSPALVNSPSRGAAKAALREVPADVTSRLGFEAHLGRAAGRADVLFCVTAVDGEREAVARWATDGAFTLEPSVRSGIDALASEWMRPGGALHERISNLWFEWDAVPDAVGRPSVFVGLDDSAIFGAETGRCRAEAQRDLVATRTALQRLTGRSLRPQVTAALSRCFQALPRSAKLFQAGVRPADGVEAVRVCVRRVPRTGLSAYLEDAGWSGDVGGVRSLLDDLSRRAELLSLDLDITPDGVAPRLGIECSFRLQPAEEPRWRSLLEHVRELGLCEREQLEALLCWDAVDWPRGARGGSVVRAVSHVKIVVENEVPAAAKAYFGAWRRAPMGFLHCPAP